MEKGYTFHPCADAISDCRQNSFQGHIIKNQNCFVFIRLCFNVTGILAVNGEDGVGNRAFQIAIVVFRPKEEPLMLQFSPRPITTLIGREDARKSGRCITRFAVGKLKMRVMPVTIRTRAGAGLNCNPLIYVGHFCVAKRLRKSRKSFILYGGRRIS